MIGQTISHFRILDTLGKGGMGVVYRALDINLDREVAIKFLPSDISSDPDAKARFIQEAKSASSLDHPNICTIYEIGEMDDGRLFMAMALYKGQALKEVLKNGPLPVSDCIPIWHSRKILLTVRRLPRKWLVFAACWSPPTTLGRPREWRLRRPLGKPLICAVPQ